MTENDYDQIGGHTKEEADAAYAELFKELHGEDQEGFGALEAFSENVAVVGRRVPDTDSICSAIAYARLKNEIDKTSVYIPYRAGDINDETRYALKYFGAAEPELFQAGAQKIVLVDHNGLTQMANGIMIKDVLEIIDHHRLEGVKTPRPVWVRCQPYGATCTIIYEMYQEQGVVPDSRTAGLLCAAIISDTERLKSETATRTDRLACAALANIAGLDIEAFAAEMLNKRG